MVKELELYMGLLTLSAVLLALVPTLNQLLIQQKEFPTSIINRYLPRLTTAAFLYGIGVILAASGIYFKWNAFFPVTLTYVAIALFATYTIWIFYQYLKIRDSILKKITKRGDI